MRGPTVLRPARTAGSIPPDGPRRNRAPAVAGRRVVARSAARDTAPARAGWQVWLWLTAERIRLGGPGVSRGVGLPRIRGGDEERSARELNPARPKAAGVRDRCDEP